ncbi:MAG TPA: hypothetical protein VH479_08225 [Acidimicrobiales bacterium]
MPAAVGEVGQRVDRRPHREVDDLQVVVEHLDAGGVARLVLEAPHEAGAGLGQGVDALQVGPEAVDAGVLDRRPQPADVQLGEVHGPHRKDGCRQVRAKR